MPSIADAILQLEKFSKEELKDSVSEMLDEILNLLKKHSDETQLTDENVEELRKNLISLGHNEQIEKIKKGNPSLADAIYTTSLALAEYKPIINDKDENKNPIDSITLEAFSEDKIVFSTGHQFNLDSLIEYHNKRKYRDKSPIEYEKEKYLINPLTNKKFSERDVKHFLDVINFKNKVKVFKNEKDFFVVENLKLDSGKVYFEFSGYEKIKKTEWRLALDHWDWDKMLTGNDRARVKCYDNIGPGCNGILSISLLGFTDDTYGIRLSSGELIRSFISGELLPTVCFDGNKKLIDALQEGNIYSNTFNVITYPGKKSPHFEIRGSLEEINSLLPNVLNIIKKLEGNIDSIENDIINSFQPYTLFFDLDLD